jgi:hypothetical protein
MRKLIATVILFGLGTGLALAEGGGDSNTWIGKSMQQVQRGGHGTQFDQNGQERFIGR